jgi:hypothetical protein
MCLILQRIWRQNYVELHRIGELKKKILLAVSDNAYNIQNALSIQLNWRHFGCFAHSINLIVKEGLKSTDMQQLISKVKIIVTHFRKSYIANEKLLIFQRQNGLNKTALKFEINERCCNSLQLNLLHIREIYKMRDGC